MEALRSTGVYVDGYNLFYGRLRGTPYKWLDLVGLFESILHAQDPSQPLALLRYFSAPALARFATNGTASVAAQQDYHRALVRMHAGRLSVRLGSHSCDRSGTPIPRFVKGVPYDRKDRVRVWKIEEKQTDVNIALAMYRDACARRFSQLVLCSNDSDVAPVLEAIREDFPSMTLGVVVPRPPSAAGRVASPDLAKWAHWARHHILDDELALSQLPALIHTGRKPIRRPLHW